LSKERGKKVLRLSSLLMYGSGCRSWYLEWYGYSRVSVLVVLSLLPIQLALWAINDIAAINLL
jgi:hypothetical protein